MKEIPSDDFKIKVNKLTLTFKTVNKEVDIYTCWQSKPIARAVAVVTLIVIRDDRWQFINVKSTAVANADEGWVLTAPLVSCKTHFTQNSTIWHGRMSSTEPSRMPRTTVMLLNTCVSHLSSSLSTKTVPAKKFGSVITIHQNTTVVCHCSRAII